jgi:galactose-1-phosphate uridylyltransferase
MAKKSLLRMEIYLGYIMFEKRILSARFFNPLTGFEEDEQPIEYRKDPLLGIWCRINVKRTERVKQGQGETEFGELIERSREKCFFCPGNLKRDTPRFMPSIAPEGRIKLGETWVFPNLFPFSQYHAIATISEEHFLDLNEFSQRQIEDTLNASIDYFSRIYRKDREAKYPSFNWNHLPSSGASIVHPHVQLVMDRSPTCITDLYLRASERYYKEKKENYWERLVEEEEKGERFIASLGGISWFTSFVPLGNNEVNAVFRRGSLLELESREITAFAEGLRKVLKGYFNLGVRSFNLTTYSAPVGEEREDFWLSAKIISRPTPQRYYTADAGFMEVLHRERIVESMPEKVAEALRKEFE